ncbi:hypothetical protein WJX79_008815 [Trebouxia sp. C0005]
MAPSKTSRKGKKAWRKNINTRQLEEDLTRHQKEEQEGTALQTFSDSNLFFVDKAGDEQTASAVAKGLTKKRKQLSKPLRYAAAAASGKPAAAVSLRTKRIKKDRGLELRRRPREEEDERRRTLKAQRRDIDNVKHIQQQLQEEEADREEMRAAKAASKAEKAMHEPPRLGKVKFEAEPVQVLLSEEVSGSLRKLRPTATLTRDRFKSLQRQGIIEPRVAAKGRKQPKRVSYTQGERADNAEAGMEEIRALQNKRKQK